MADAPARLQNFKPGLTKFGDASHWLSILATELHLRLCEAREISPGLWVRLFLHRFRSC